MMKPIVNINGTSREELVQQRIDVLDRLREAMTAMMGIRPHRRDYQNYPDDTQFQADCDLQNSRFNMLYALKSEIEEEALAIREGK